MSYVHQWCLQVCVKAIENLNDRNLLHQSLVVVKEWCLAHGFLKLNCKKWYSISFGNTMTSEFTYSLCNFFFFRKYRYFNSLSNAIHPIQIHISVLEKLRFEYKVKKILTSNIWNLWTNHFVQRTRSRTMQNLPLEGILKRLSQFYS